MSINYKEHINSEPSDNVNDSKLPIIFLIDSDREFFPLFTPSTEDTW